jgi:hypothetical protein
MRLEGILALLQLRIGRRVSYSVVWSLLCPGLSRRAYWYSPASADPAASTIKAEPTTRPHCVIFQKTYSPHKHHHANPTSWALHMLCVSVNKQDNSRQLQLTVFIYCMIVTATCFASYTRSRHQADKLPKKAIKSRVSKLLMAKGHSRHCGLGRGP